MRPLSIITPLAAAALALALSACAPSYTGGARAVEPASIGQEWAAVRSLPAVPQRGESDCGAAAMTGVLRYHRVDADAAAIERQLRPAGADGIRAGLLRDYARRRGLRAYLISARVDDLMYEIERGRPVIVGTLKRYGDRIAYEHYEVVFAISRDGAHVATYDPAAGWRRYTRADFLAEWKPTGQLALVMLPGIDGARAAR